MDGKKLEPTRDHDADRGSPKSGPALERREEVVRFGISAAPGIVIGRAFGSMFWCISSPDSGELPAW